MTNDALTVAEAAALVGTCAACLLAAIHRGELAAEVVDGEVYVHRAGLEDFVVGTGVVADR